MALLVLNLGASGFGAFKIDDRVAGGSRDRACQREKSGKEITGPVVALDPFVVNLDEPGTSAT